MPVPPDAKEKSDAISAALRDAVADALDRKRKLGQYWVVWDGEKPVEVHPDTKQTAAE
ncbi:hypothetical protein ABI_07420 [Asticcacaulis biprosthecium C19]|uniref:Uncharacterized protein n=1 Tax=Asticcacaulis biprosthecium C19 TaxID=715226 RepID=F4QLG3_9CAUL|nr:hypothetical protein [Asticcacaulis biprosthecium]EGF92308.1 hypothetical protein ABI_07420 [Asticcacaulis biprosthecium C19]